MGVDAAFFSFNLKKGRVDLEIEDGLSSFSDLLIDGFEVLAQLGVEIRGG